jgi:hypothetical protein
MITRLVSEYVFDRAKRNSRAVKLALDFLLLAKSKTYSRAL